MVCFVKAEAGSKMRSRLEYVNGMEAEIQVTLGFTMAHYVIDPHTHDWILQIRVVSPVRPETGMGPNGITIRDNVENIIVSKYANRCIVGPDEKADHIVAAHTEKTRVGGKWVTERWDQVPTLECIAERMLEDIVRLEEMNGLDGELVSITLAETERTSVTLKPTGSKSFHE